MRILMDAHSDFPSVARKQGRSYAVILHCIRNVIGQLRHCVRGVATNAKAHSAATHSPGELNCLRPGWDPAVEWVIKLKVIAACLEAVCSPLGNLIERLAFSQCYATIFTALIIDHPQQTCAVIRCLRLRGCGWLRSGSSGWLRSWRCGWLRLGSSGWLRLGSSGWLRS